MQAPPRRIRDQDAAAAAWQPELTQRAARATNAAGAEPYEVATFE